MRILAVVASAIGTLLVWTALQPQALYADSTLDSYKRVDGLKGCDSIPYDTLRSRCIDTSVDVQNYCKEKELKRSCKELPKVRDAYDDPKLKDDPHAQKE